MEKEKIFEIIETMGFRKITNRLRYLHEITMDDDPDEPPMLVDSLIEMALFISQYGRILPYPQIGICPDGSLQIEWHSMPASAIINFMPDGSVEFAGVLENQNLPLRLQGSGSKENAMQMILPFLRAIP